MRKVYGIAVGLLAGCASPADARRDDCVCGTEDDTDETSASSDRDASGGETDLPADDDVSTDTDAATETDAPVDCDVGLAEGDCPPSFSLPRVGGGMLGWQDHPGQRVVVFGSGFWCPICRDVAQDLAAWTPPSDVVLLNVLVEDNGGDAPSLAEAEQWKTGLGLPFDVLADTDHAWADVWSTGGHRHTYTVIGADGRVAWHVDGYRSATASDVMDAVSDAPAP